MSLDNFVDVRIVDNFYQTSSLFPMPVVLVSTLHESGQANRRHSSPDGVRISVDRSMGLEPFHFVYRLLRYDHKRMALPLNRNRTSGLEYVI